MKLTIYILFLVLLFSCDNGNKYIQHESVPHYVIKSSYDSADNPENFFSIRYFDKTDRLLREVDVDGGCTRYIYNKDGKLIETNRGRTCEYRGMRKIFMFDSIGNHIGYYWTRDTIVNLDTVKFEQTHFYDTENRLIKEKTDERTDMQGKTIKTWNNYSYEGSLKTSVVIKKNNITNWIGTYKYNIKGMLVECNKVLNKRFEIEYFTYDDLDRLIEERIISNDKLIIPEGTFYMPEIRKTYKYDSVGFLKRKTVYRDKKIVSKTFYTKTLVNN